MITYVALNSSNCGLFLCDSYNRIVAHMVVFADYVFKLRCFVCGHKKVPMWGINGIAATRVCVQALGMVGWHAYEFFL
jgi:hypothetical protein